MKRWLRTGLLIVFLGVFLVSAGLLIQYALQSAKQKSQFEKLADMIETVPAATAGENESDHVPALPPTVEVEDKNGETVTVLQAYRRLHEENKDLVGWLRVPGTTIDYPVLQTPESPDYYLYRDFYGKDSIHGCIYAYEPCDVAKPSDQIVLYGHKMKDGTMFAPLLSYRDEAFFKTNPVIRFDSIGEHRTYEILSVFVTSAAEGEGFPFYDFVDAADEAEFDAYVAQIKSLSLYDTGVDAVYGDKLLTLCTCEYSIENGRLLVIAKQMQIQEE